MLAAQYVNCSHYAPGALAKLSCLSAKLTEILQCMEVDGTDTVDIGCVMCVCVSDSTKWSMLLPYI